MTTIRERVGVEPTDNLPAHAWPGGYDILYVTDDGGVLCAACANANGSELEEDRGTGWYLDAVTTAADSDSCSNCDNCGAQLAAYCDADEHSEHCDNHA